MKFWGLGFCVFGFGVWGLRHKASQIPFPQTLSLNPKPSARNPKPHTPALNRLPKPHNFSEGLVVLVSMLYQVVVQGLFVPEIVSA